MKFLLINQSGLAIVGIVCTRMGFLFSQVHFSKRSPDPHTIFLSRGKYQERDPEGVMVNWIGLLIIVFAVVVVYLTGNPRYKRLMRPEDEMLLVENPHE